MDWRSLAPRPDDPQWDLAAESIAVKIRWFGLAVGLLIANWGGGPADPIPLNAILAFGLGFTSLDTALFLRGRVFLRDFPLVISAMEALFIGLLCLYETGPESPFRFYYLLSVICCAIRYAPRTTFATCAFDCVSFGLVCAAQPNDRSAASLSLFFFQVVVLVWITWAAAALARLLKRAGDDTRELNAALRETQAQLETRIAERTRELEESQAQVLHQEKMAAFGLLAAGIAHEVGNPLSGISGVVQMLDRRDQDAYTREKLALVTTQLARIQGTLRELVTFSRPASDQIGRVSVREVIDEALAIAKFYKGGKNRQIVLAVADELPLLLGVRDQFVQVVFNLVLNSIDATGKGGRIEVAAKCEDGRIVLEVSDDGVGIDPTHLERLFHPYFTTKKHGTGLGLFVIRKIVEAHGGTVQVASEPGRGASFRVALPGGVHRNPVAPPSAIAVR